MLRSFVIAIQLLKKEMFAISQSGETADTLAAIELAKSKGAIIFGLCNVVGSSIARVSHEGAYTHAGPEIGVASTKAFTAQLTVMFMIALKVAIRNGTISESKYRELLVELENMLPTCSILEGDITSR